MSPEHPLTNANEIKFKSNKFRQLSAVALALGTLAFTPPAYSQENTSPNQEVTPKLRKQLNECMKTVNNEPSTRAMAGAIIDSAFDSTDNVPPGTEKEIMKDILGAKIAARICFDRYGVELKKIEVKPAEPQQK